MPLINCEISLQLEWSRDWYQAAGTAANQEPKFEKTDTIFYLPVVVTLLPQDNVTLLKQLESSFKKTINWNKYQSKKTNQVQNKYFLFDTSLQVDNENGGESYK